MTNTTELGLYTSGLKTFWVAVEFLPRQDKAASRQAMGQNPGQSPAMPVVSWCWVEDDHRLEEVLGA